jgi:hypothetical protein
MHTAKLSMEYKLGPAYDTGRARLTSRSLGGEWAVELVEGVAVEVESDSVPKRLRGAVPVPVPVEGGIHAWMHKLLPACVRRRRTPVELELYMLAADEYVCGMSSVGAGLCSLRSLAAGGSSVAGANRLPQTNAAAVGEGANDTTLGSACRAEFKSCTRSCSCSPARQVHVHNSKIKRTPTQLRKK